MKVCATFRYRIFMVVCKLYLVGSLASPTVVVVRYRATAVTVVIELDVLAVLGEHSQRALVTLDLSGHELEFRHRVEQLRQVSVNNQRFKNQHFNNQRFNLQYFNNRRYNSEHSKNQNINN